MSRKLYDDLKEVVMIPGISGYEDEVRDYIKNYVGKRFKTEEDAMGNLILNMGDGKKGPSIAVVAHMDEVGMVVSNILLAMGMQMLSPVTISLPFKLLLFILIDGWYLLARGLVMGYL